MSRLFSNEMKTVRSRSLWSPLKALVLSALIAAGILTTHAPRLMAQTDFYNTDRGRPIQIEDAYVTERYAFELKLAPVRLEHTGRGVYNWGLDPEIAYGILPRTQVEISLPLAYHEAGTQRTSGVAGLEFSVMHNLNTETETWPALGIRADLLTPVGNLAPARAYPSVTGMATRTYPWARFHFNAQYTAGEFRETTAVRAGVAEVSRWLVGGAIDKTYPLRSTLITAEFFGRRPIDSRDAVEYTTGVGARHQVSPTLALDAGLGRRLSGNAPGWYVTFGSAYAFSLAGLFPAGN